jgi:hypothetical protein
MLTETKFCMLNIYFLFTTLHTNFCFLHSIPQLLCSTKMEISLLCPDSNKLSQYLNPTLWHYHCKVILFDFVLKLFTYLRGRVWHVTHYWKCIFLPSDWMHNGIPNVPIWKHTCTWNQPLDFWLFCLSAMWNKGMWTRLHLYFHTIKYSRLLNKFILKLITIFFRNMPPVHYAASFLSSG